MEQQRVWLVSAILVVVVALLACDAGTFTAFLDAGTATPTRTPRATFTPRATATPESTSTPEASPTTAASPTLTPRPTLRPATAKPAAPTAPPAPSFPVQVTDAFDCPQGAQASVYEVLVRVNRSTPPHIFLGNYVIELRSPDGSLRKTSVTVPDDQQYMSMLGGANCRAENFWPYNGKIDGAEVRGLPGPYFVRIIKAVNDSTPLSRDVPVHFQQSVRWIIYFSAAQ